MSWLRDHINRNPGRVYYTAVDPADFYEWKISGEIPGGTRFSRTLPPSEVFTKGFVVASAQLPPESLKGVENNMVELTKTIQAEIQFQVGTVLSPTELLNKYHAMKEKFIRDANHFRTVALAQAFIVNPADNKVYKVTEQDGRAAIDEYEKFEQVQKKLTIARRALSQDAVKKKWRAFELEPLRRFEHAFVMINNKNTVVEPSDIAKAFTMAGIEPVRSYTMGWNEYYTTISSDAKQQQERLQALDGLRWIKDAESLA
jgi:hypothetical protein